MRKAPDDSRSDSSAMISLCVWLAEGFPRSCAGSFKQVLFKIENIELICLEVLIGVQDRQLSHMEAFDKPN